MLKSIPMTTGRPVIRNRPRGKDIVLNVPVENHNADAAAGILADKPVVNGNYQLNAWETCIYYCDKLAEEGYSWRMIMLPISLLTMKTLVRISLRFLWIKTCMSISFIISSALIIMRMAGFWMGQSEMVLVLRFPR